VADKKQINVGALDSFAKQVAAVYKNLEQLELKLDGGLIKRFGDLAKGVNLFSNALETLTKVNISDIAQSVAKIEKMFSEIEKLDASLQSSGKLDASPLVKFANSLYRFTLAMKDAADINTNDSPLLKVTTLLKDFTKGFNVSFSGQLIQISDTVDNFSKTIRNLAKLAPAIKELDNLSLGDATSSSFVTWIKDFQATLKPLLEMKLPTTKLTSLVDILKSLQEFSVALKGATFDQAALQGLTNFILGIVDAFKKMSEAFNSADSGGSVIAKVFGQATSVKTSLAFIPDLVKSLVTLLEQVKNVPSTSTSSAALTNVLNFLSAIQDFLKQMYAALNSVPQTKGGIISRIVDTWVKSVIDLKPITTIVELLQTISKVSSLDAATAKAVGDIFANVTNLMSTLFGIFQQTTTLSFGNIAKTVLQNFLTFRIFMASFNTTLASLTSILQVAAKQPTESVQAVASIISGFASSLQGIIAALNVTNALFTKSTFLENAKDILARLVTFRLFVGQIVVVIKQLLNSTKGFDVGQIAAVGSLTKGLGSLFGNLAEFFKFISSDKFLPDLSVIGIIQKFVRVAVGLSPLVGVLAILKPIFNASKSVDVGAVAEFTRSIGGLFKGLSELFNSTRLIDLSFIDSIKTALSLGRLIGPIRSLISAFNIKLPKGVNIDSLKGYLNSILGFIKFIGANFKTGSVEAFVQLKKTIQSVFAAVAVPFPRELLSSLKLSDKLSSYAEGLKSLFAVVKQLPTLIKDVGEIGGGGAIDNNSIKSLSSFVQTLLKEFSNISEKDLKRLATISKSFSEVTGALKGLGTTNTGGTAATPFTGSVADEVKKGIRGFAVELLGAKVAVDTFSAALTLLNPVNIIAALDSVGKRVDAFINQIKDAFKQIEQLGSSIRQFGTTVLDNFGIGRLINSSAFQSTVEFDKLGSSLEVFGGLTKEQRKQAEDFASVIGKDYPLSANEALAATLDLIKAGQDLESTQFILPAAADLASLSDSGSIENATAFIIQATATFDEFSETVAGSFDNAATAVDIISAAADSSTASVEGLAEGLANVGPVANTFGLSLEETTAALAIFTDGGLSGAEAGTQLKSILTSLTSDAARKELRRLGISVSDAAGNIRPLNDILNDIQKSFTQTATVTFRTSKQLSGPDADRLKIAQKALAGAVRQQTLLEGDLSSTALGKNADKKLEEAKTIANNATAIITELTGSAAEAENITRTIRRTEIQNAESLKKIAGSYGQAGLAILIAQGEDGLKSFVEQMQAVEPASVRARKALDNINGDFIQLQGSVETLGTKALLPLLEKFFRPFVQVARFVVDGILGMDEKFIEFIATALTLGSALATAVGGIAIFVGAIVQLGGVFLSAFAFFATSAIPTIVTGFLAGLAGFTAGIIALAGGLAILVPVLTTITTGFETLYKIFNEDRGGATTQLQNLANNVGGALGQIADAITSVVKVISFIVSGSEGVDLDTFGKNIASFFNSISLSVTKFKTSGVGKTMSDIGDIFSGFFRTLTFEDATKEVEQGITDFADAFGGQGTAGNAEIRARQAREGMTKNYAQFILDIAKNNRLLRSIVGDNATLDQLTAYFDQIFEIADNIRTDISSVFGSFGSAFTTAQAVFKDKGLGAGITTFLSELGKNLDKTLGDLASTILNSIGQLFNLDFKDLSAVFDIKGFGAGVGELIQRGLQAALKFVITNRSTIKGFFTGLFDFFVVGGLQQAANTLNLIGASDLADALQGVVDFIRGLFGGIFDTIFNLLEGQDLTTALTNAFGPGIEPFLGLVDTFGKAVSNVVGFIGKLIAALFGQGEVARGADINQESPLLTIFNGIVTGLTGFLDFVNNNFLNFLAEGDIVGLVNNIATQINGFLSGIDFIAVFASVAATIGNGLLSALSTGLSTLGSVFGFDGTALLDSIGEALSTAINSADSASAFADVRLAIENAFKAITGLFGGEDGSIFDSIQSIIDKFVSALNSLFAVFGTPEANTAKTDAPKLSDALQSVINVLAGITSTVANTIADLASGLDQLVSSFAKMSAGEIFVTGAAFLSVLAGIALYAGVPAILSALGTGILGVIIPLVVFSQALRAVFQNLDKFKGVIEAIRDGNLGEALSKAIGSISGVLIDTGFNLAGILGIDTIAGQTREEIKRTADIMVALLTNSANLAGNQIRVGIIQPISDFINVTIPLALSEIERLGASLKAATGDKNAQAVVDTFNAIDTITSDSLSFDFGSDTERFNNFLQTVEAGGDVAKRRFLATFSANFDDIYDQALQDVANNVDAPPEVRNAVIDNIAGLFTLAGKSDELLARVLSEGNGGLFNDILLSMSLSGTFTTEQSSALATSLGESIALSFNAIDPDSVASSINQLDLAIEAFTNFGLDTTQLEQQKLSLQNQVNAILAAGEPIPAETTVPVNTTLDPTIVNPDAPADTVPPVSATPAEQTQDVIVRPNFKLLGEADADQVVPGPGQKVESATEAVAGAAPDTAFDSSSLSDPTKVTEFNALVTTLTDNVKTLATELNGLTSTQTIVATTLSAIQTSITTFRDVTVPMFGEVNTAAGGLATTISSLSLSLISLLAFGSIGFPAFAASAILSLIGITTQFQILQTVAETSIQTATNKVIKLADALREAALAASVLSANAVLTSAMSGGATGSPPGRAGGGSTDPFSVYKVLRGDTDKPEIYTENGQSYLLTGKNSGYVSNLSSSVSTGLYGGPRANPAMAGAGGGNNVIIEMGGLTVQVSGTNLNDPKTVAATITPAIEKALAKQNGRLSETLRKHNR
jgi:TP901 family phage tail tape measure protein